MLQQQQSFPNRKLFSTLDYCVKLFICLNVRVDVMVFDFAIEDQLQIVKNKLMSKMRAFPIVPAVWSQF